MVKLSAEAGELAQLIASQARDDRSRHVRRSGPLTNVDLDRIAVEPSPIRIREGRPQHYRPNPVGTCPECGGDAGGDICLPCDGGARGRRLRGRERSDVGGPTSYQGTGRYKGGKDR